MDNVMIRMETVSKQLKGMKSLKKIPKHLEGDPIIRTFSNQLQKALKDNLVFKILFGSRARQDFREYSDYDFLIIIDHKDEKVREDVENIGSDILYNYNILVSCLIWPVDEWELNSKFPIGMNILREGILL
jgi:predicted nucleotidyltransferase